MLTAILIAVFAMQLSAQDEVTMDESAVDDDSELRADYSDFWYEDGW